MNPANFITLFRIFLVPFFFTELVSYRNGGEPHRWVAFGIFLFASLTDALDGFLARIMKTRTAFGRFLDPLADKLLLLSGFLGLLFVGTLSYHPPLWVTVTVVFRDIVIIIGLIVVYLITGHVNVKPNLLGKATTALQMATLISILLELKISPLLCYATAFLTIASCIAYIVRDLNLLKNTP